MPNLALFAGGQINDDWGGQSSSAVDIFNSSSFQWTTAALTVARFALAAASVNNLALFSPGRYTVNAVDIFNSVSGQWTTAALSVNRWSTGAASTSNMALFAGGDTGSCPSQCNTVDIFTLGAHHFATTAIPSTTSRAPSTASPPTTAATAIPVTSHPPAPPSVSSSSLPTSTPPPFPASSSIPSSPIPTFMAAAAAATSGHMPRALELVQFLSIYCTSLSSRQQTRVSDFQVASITHISTKAGYCDVCPGCCTQPLALIVPTFAAMSCLFALGLFVMAFDAYKSCNHSRFAPPVHSRLLETGAASSVVAARERFSLLRTMTAFCVRYFRGMIETCSAYVLMPCTFVFVLNAQPSAFAQAGSSDRAMIVMLPVMMILLRVLVIRQRVVQLTSADQKQLYASSICSLLIAAVLSESFARAADARQSAPSFATDTSTQFIILALLIVQIITQTVIRCRATSTSAFDNTDWPWSSASSHASAQFSFDELMSRLLMGSIKSASSSSATAAVKFFLLNYVALSQMAMVVAGLASSGATFASSIEASSVFIGSVPLITSGALLLHNAVKFIYFLRQKCCRRPNRTGSLLSNTNNFDS